MIPQYIKYLGSSSYGLIAFNATAMAIFVILDTGISGTAVKKITEFRSGLISEQVLSEHLNNLEKVFLVIGLLGICIFYLCTDLLVNNWGNKTELEAVTISQAMLLICSIILCRWMFMLYRSILIGYERIYLVSNLAVISSALKYTVVIFYLMYFNLGIVGFFYYQLFMTAAEALVVFLFARSITPLPEKSWWTFNLKSIHGTLNFTYQLGTISVLWALLSQLDRIAATLLFSLDNYGKYMMGALAASVIIYFNTGFYNVMLPRISVLFQKKELELCKLTYFGYTIIYIVLLVPLASVGVFNAETVFNIWTRGAEIDVWMLDVFRFLLLGNLFVPLLSFTFIIQYAAGNLKISKAVNASGIILLPAGMILAYPVFGKAAIAMIWPSFVVSGALICAFITHKTYLKGANRFWFIGLLMPGYAAGAIGAFIFSTGVTEIDGIIGLLVSYISSILLILITLNSKLKLAGRIW